MYVVPDLASIVLNLAAAAPIKVTLAKLRWEREE